MDYGARTEFGAQHGLNVIVENHGGLSSSGAWLSQVMKTVDHRNCGTLPDFGNFGIDRNQGEWYGRYKGTQELMPFARAVSAKTYEFDEQRPFVTVDGRWKKETDFLKIMKIVLDAGYRGYVGIEHEGRNPDEVSGIRKSKELLQRYEVELAGA